MTFCKELAKAERNGKIISAWELSDFGCGAKRYEVSVSVDGIAYQTVQTARTTWRKKFREVLDNE